MINLLVVAVAVAVTAFLAVSGMLIARLLRDKRREQGEAAVAKAAQAYLARFGIRARTVAVTLPDQRVVLMVETPPHKKLRFSHIIEQPIKQFVLKQTQVEVDRLFWRFPMPAKDTHAPDVQYGVTTTQNMPNTAPAQAPETKQTTSPAQEDEDDYFKRQAYRIEEVSWEDFSVVSKSDSNTKPSKH